MTAQTFAAPTMQAAFRRVRDKLGASAVILKVVTSAAGVEVVAGRERPRSGLRRLIESQSRATVEVVSPPSEFDAGAGSMGGRWGDDLPALRVVAGPGARRSTLSTTLNRLEFPPDLAAKLSAVAGEGAAAWPRLLEWLERVHPVTEPAVDAGGLALAFIGGRGAGRTTLVRGLASRAAIAEPGRVLWVQVGFPARPASPLDDFLAPLGVDHRIANHPDEIAPIADEHADVSATLIDLPGIDLHNKSQRGSLGRFVKACRSTWPDISLHGVVPANWSVREAVRCMGEQASMGASGAAWTHVDRVADPATIVAATLRSELSPSFLHGDSHGEGDTSRAASWTEIVDWLRAGNEKGLEEPK